MMKNGDQIKVHLPGEWPWAEVVEIIDPYFIRAKLLNEPVNNDIAWGEEKFFSLRDGVWELCQ